MASPVSTWPPKPNRIADKTFSPNVWSSRERKRANRAAASTLAGTASSTAASSVQRPSPLSATWPEKFDRSGFPTRADAVRSSSHELTTLPPPPHFGDVGQVEVEALVFGQFVRILALEDVEPLGIGLHQAVFDAVMDHFDEMAGAGRPGMDIAFLRAVVGELVAAARTVDVASSRREGLEDGVEVVDRFLAAADHHAITAVEAPNAARGADIDEMHALRLEHRGVGDVVLVEGVAAVDDDVARAEQAGELVDGRLGDLSGRAA